MVRFELESDRDVLVAGIGLLPAGQPVEVSEFDAMMFKNFHGVNLVNGQFPNYVSVTAVWTADAEEDGGV